MYFGVSIALALAIAFVLGRTYRNEEAINALRKRIARLERRK